jgi:hypothetical protein
MTMQFASGTARFITGKIGQIDKQNINISTPTAQIAIRGTDFTVTVDEFGRSLVILLPDANGLPSGEIVVATAMGEVVLIISPPKENEELQQTEGQSGDSDSSSNLLDIDFLADDSLDIDYLAEDSLEFSELDIEYLDVDFLEDLLEVIEELDELETEDALAASLYSPIDIQGTEYGNDPSTQITTFGDAEKITLIRQVTQYVQLDLNGETGYNIIIEQDGKAYNVILNSASNTTISIRQSGG